MRNIIIGLWLATTALASGCGREISHLRGCENRLASEYKRMECTACVTRPRPHVFHPDQPDGTRCRLR